MDLFGPVSVLNINKGSYCLVVKDDYSRFTWVFFLSNKSGIVDLINKFIMMIENQTNKKVKALRTDNGTEFKNVVLDHFCAEKGIMRQYSDVRTPQQNYVAERRNHTLMDAARTMFYDVSGFCSGTKVVIEDEEEDVVYRPPLVSPTTPMVDEAVPSTSLGSSSQRINPDVEATPLTPAGREFMTRDTSAATQSFMELLFPWPIANEYVASTSHGSRSFEADDGLININNLPVTINDINHEVPIRLQRDHPIENVIG
ncbi:hypothetical protein Lser_V15G22456 [Lactuca serriola]